MHCFVRGLRLLLVLQPLSATAFRTKRCFLTSEFGLNEALFPTKTDKPDPLPVESPLTLWESPHPSATNRNPYRGGGASKGRLKYSKIALVRFQMSNSDMLARSHISFIGLNPEEMKPTSSIGSSLRWASGAPMIL